LTPYSLLLARFLRLDVCAACRNAEETVLLAFEVVIVKKEVVMVIDYRSSTICACSFAMRRSLFVIECIMYLDLGVSSELYFDILTPPARFG